MKKTTFFLSSLLCFCAPLLSAQQTPISEKPNDRVNFPSNFQVASGADLILYGDYLYWIAQEDGLYYAQTGAGSGTSTSPPNSNIDFKGQLRKVKPSWESGVRAGLGINFPKEGWDLLAYWTWLSTTAQDSVHSSSADLLSLWAQPDFSSFTGDRFAKASWSMDLNIGDVEWGRSSWFGGHFSLRPFMGLRGLWLDQDLKNQYVYNTSPITQGHLYLSSDFRGGGLRAGADSRFALPYGFSIYGLASGSLLYGQFHTNFDFKEDQTTIAKTHDPFWKGISALQLNLGFSWDSHFWDDHCHVEFHLGWEQNIFFSVNQMNHFMNRLHDGAYFKENGNLSLQGLVAGGRFDF